MAISTEAKRNAALKDPCGILFPTGAIDAAGRQTLVGDYFVSGSPPPPPQPLASGGVVVTYIPLSGK